MDRLERYAPQPPWAWKKRKWPIKLLKLILLLLVIAAILFCIYQVVNASIILKDVDEKNPNISIYYLGDHNPTGWTKLHIGNKITKIDDVFTSELVSGDLLFIGDDLMGDNKKDSELTLELLRLVDNGVGIVVYTDKVMEKTWINILDDKYQWIDGSEFDPYYIYLDDSEKIHYTKHLSISTNIRILDEAILFEETINKVN